MRKENKTNTYRGKKSNEIIHNDLKYFLGVNLTKGGDLNNENFRTLSKEFEEDTSRRKYPMVMNS